MKWIIGPVALVLAVACTATLAARKSSGSHLEVRPVFFRRCPNVANNALGKLGVNYEMRGRTGVVMNLNATITRSVERWQKITIGIEKCDEGVTTTTCTPFRTLDFTDVCPTMMNPGMPWAKIVADVRPKLNCPIMKGEYILRNGTLSMDLLNAMGATLRLEGYVWRTISTTYATKDSTHFCVDAAAEFFRVRNRGPPEKS